MGTGMTLILAACAVLASLSAILVPEGEAAKAQGTSQPRTGSANSPVCGDKLCSEIADSPWQHARPAPQIDGCKSHEGQTRTYYIAADEAVWDYAPAGMNRISGHEFGGDEDVFVSAAENQIGSKYKKALYRQYEDGTFEERVQRPAEWEHLGVLGPVIRAEVCDTIVVVFRNNAAELDYSMHPHGVFYEKDSEGAGYGGAPGAGDAVPPGGEHTYVWPVPPRAGPGPSDPSSIVWMYHSHVDSVMDTNSGLVGPIIITARGMADKDGRPADVDAEVVSLFTVHDENSSHYLCENAESTGSTCGELAGDGDFEEGNLMHGINGYVYGNQPVPELKKGENVRWYLIGMGTEVDLHTPHWHGQTALWNGMRVDVMELLPASLKTVDLVPDNAGTWLFHCHVNDHISAGMQSLFRVA